MEVEEVETLNVFFKEFCCTIEHRKGFLLVGGSRIKMSFH